MQRFSENNRISARQAFRLLVYDLLGLSTLLIPSALGRISGRDGIFCIAIGLGTGLLYLRLLCAGMRERAVPFPVLLEQRMGIVFGRLAQGGFFLYLLLLAGYTAYLFADVVLQSLLREESFVLVLLLLLLFALYGLWGGLEGRARVYEMLFWFLLVPFFGMLFFSVDEIRTDYWCPVFVSSARDIFAGSYEVFCCFAIIFLTVFLDAHMKDGKQAYAMGRRALVFVGGVHGILYLVLLGIFGADALGGMQYPAVTLMSTVRISGGFFKRADAFMFAVWFFTLYALLSSCIFYAGSLLVQMTGRCKSSCEKAKKQHGAYGILVVLTGVLAYGMYEAQAWLEAYEWFLRYIGTPFVLFIPLVLVCRREGVRAKAAGCAGRGAVFALFLLSGIMAGCGTAELEERDFPIEMAVQDAGTFTKEFLEAQGTGSRVVDYSHLKVLILSESVAEDEMAMRELLKLLEQKNEIPQSIYVVLAKDAGALVAMKEKLGASVGDYLEQLFENVSEVKKQEYPTLGMLCQEDANQSETLFIPYVCEQEGVPVIARYYVWKRGMPCGTVESPSALLSFFTQNQMEQYQLVLADGTAVTLSDARNQISFVENGGKKTVQAAIRCNGETTKQGMEEKSTQRALTRQIEAYMNAVARQTLEAQQIDITDSFRKLGAKRDWYFYYQENPRRYEEEIQIRYEVEIDWVNL